jgi:hypothetical protein
MPGTPFIHVSLALRQTKTGQWACYFTFEGRKQEFVRPQMADAVMAAAKFLERHAPIGLMRINPQLH